MVSKNKNTSSSSQSDVSLHKKIGLVSRNELREIENIGARDDDMLIGNFLLQMREFLFLICVRKTISMKILVLRVINSSRHRNCFAPTSFPGSLFPASLSRQNRDPGCGWSSDHLSIQNRKVGGYSSTFGREDDKIPHPSSRFFYHQILGGHATRVSVPTTKGDGEERPCERGWLCSGLYSLSLFVSKALTRSFGFSHKQLVNTTPYAALSMT